MAVLAIFGTFAYIAWQTISGAISLGSMVMYYQAFQTGLNSLQSVLGGLAGLYEDNLFLTYCHEFMGLEPRVLISHRFSTVRAAHRIHILDGGRIVESGAHDELIAFCGRYAHMYEVQARAYHTGEGYGEATRPRPACPSERPGIWRSRGRR